jgi:tetratricopeptide (TPR) repeat protein
LVHRELVVLIVLIAITVAAFFGTRAVARSNENLRRRQAATLYSAAHRAPREADLDTAVAQLRRAVSKDPENRQYRLALAEALVVTGLEEEAERVLLALRQAQPEDPETNLQLARLGARGPDTDAARRYYQNALAGLWRPAEAEERRRVRLELITFLLAHEQRARAVSELLLVTPSPPSDPADNIHLAQLFLAAGDPGNALDRFVAALSTDPTNAAALAGAGEAAFSLGDYGRALRYLTKAPQEDTRIAELHEVARLVVTLDPLAPRLRAAERRRRLGLALQHVVPRLETCLSEPANRTDTTLEQLRSEARDVQSTLDAGRRELRDFVDDGIDLVYRIEQATEEACRLPAEPLDRALVRIGRRHGLGEP